MIGTRYTVLTPHGEFEALWDEDERVPVQYEGSEQAIAFFKAYMELTSVSGRGGALLNFDNLEPADLYGFCQSDEYSIAVLPEADEAVSMMIDEAAQEPDVSESLMDSVSPLDRIKLSAALAGATKSLSDEKSPLARVKLSSQIAAILVQLGVGQSSEEEELSDDPNSKNYRFRDTGYIANSRKELAANMIAMARKNGQRVRMNDVDWDAIEQNPRQAAELVKKSNLFGKTDWQALQDSGMDPAAAFLIDKIYAAIGPEPTHALTPFTMKAISSDRGDIAEIDGLDRSSMDAIARTRKDYARGLDTIRDRLESCKTVDEVLEVLKAIRDELLGVELNAEQADSVAALQVSYQEKFGALRALVNEKERLAREWNKARAAINSLEYEQEKRTRRGWKQEAGALQKIEELRPAAAAAEREYNDFLADHPELESKSRKHGGGYTSYDSDLEWELRQLRDQIKTIEREARLFNLSSNPSTRAWLTFGERFMKLVSYRSYTGSDSFAGHVTNAKNGKIKDWDWADKERPVAPKDATKGEIGFQMRVADNFERKGGKPVSVSGTAELKKMLGFRDIQSGNWVLKDPNSAKFHVEQTAAAMSDMADMLGIDMGLLGYGGRLGMAFGARGTGGKNAARAHYEPVHRVINLTKMGGGGALGHEWFHSMDNIIHEMTSGKVGEKGQFASSNPDLLPAGALREAMAAVRKEILAGSVASLERVKYTESDVRSARHNVERALPVAQAIKAAGNAEKAVLAVDGFADARKLTGKNLKAWRALAVAYYHEGEPEKGQSYYKTLATGPKVSSFFAEAIVLDAGQEGKYWSQIVELSARAFQAYLEDRLADADRRNDYLSAMADNKYHVDPLFGIEWKPFPEGEERKRINAAFDKFFASIREQKVFDKAVGNKPLMDAIFGA